MADDCCSIGWSEVVKQRKNGRDESKIDGGNFVISKLPEEIQMSFNLHAKKARQRIESWDKVIEKMLEGYADKYNMGTHVTEEAFLERQRTGVDSPKLTEDALEQVRAGTPDHAREGRSDGEKSLYSDHRVDAFTGDETPKLEAKRLSQKPVMEDEKPKGATPE